VIAACFAFYGVQNGFSYRELILAISASIGLVVVFGGEFGIAFGFVLWVLTLALAIAQWKSQRVWRFTLRNFSYGFCWFPRLRNGTCLRIAGWIRPGG
jgi:hypothetical protein